MADLQLIFSHVVRGYITVTANLFLCKSISACMRGVSIRLLLYFQLSSPLRFSQYSIRTVSTVSLPFFGRLKW